MLDVDFSALKEDPEFLEELPANVWLMDDHKWALYVWALHRDRVGGERYSLLHADFHWDATDDFFDDAPAQARLAAANADDLFAMTAAGQHIRYDSFIAPAVRRGLLSEVHFYCLQTDSDPLEDSLCEEFDTPQFVHADANGLASAAPASPLIFDLCLDLFNHSDYDFDGDLWSDEEVLAFLETVKHHIRAAELVTVSLSFGCSGTEDDTRHLAKLVVPRIVAWRS